jgi:quinol monooxygenase YgiN
MKIVRNVTLQLKPGKTGEFTRVLNAEVLPLLKQQPGFSQQLAMINGERAVGITVWNDKASMEKFQQSIYPKVVEKLTPVIEGTPKVETFDLAVATT